MEAGTTSSEPVAAGAVRRPPCPSCSHMASFYDREYTEFEKANFERVFRCRASNGQYNERHCDKCEAVLVPPRTRSWNRVSSDRT
jgi:hypothetical protein